MRQRQHCAWPAASSPGGGADLLLRAFVLVLLMHGLATAPASAATFEPSHAAGMGDFLVVRAAALGLGAVQVRRLRDGDLPIVFGEYDWKLNRTSSERRP